MTRRATETEFDTVVVGAGIAGLACARCATRRVQEQPVDHGAAFLHGTDDGFLGAISEVEGAVLLQRWPQRIEGSGAPCLPKAFEPREQWLAFGEGLTVFPKHLARGLDLRLETPVVGISEAPGGLRVHTEDGASAWTRSVVLAVPPPTALKLLRPVAGQGREAAAVLALLGMIGSQASLTLLAGYPLDAARPSWDICYPDDSAIVQLISQDSSKRQAPRFLVLVVQAKPCWSLAQLEAREDSWVPAIIRETARIVGMWAGRPLWSQPHRWRFARSDRGSELTRPVALRLLGGGVVIVTGESFAPGGGIEAAWLAGLASARRLLERE